jgi:predicted acyltransferase (DUF342 family)
MNREVSVGTSRKIAGTELGEIKRERSIIYDRRPATYKRERLKRKAFSYFGNVHIRGDVTIEDKLVVGGNLIVEGNLNAGSVYCVGRISVQGNIKGGECFIGKSILSGGSIDLCHLETDCDSEYIASWIGLEDDFEAGISAVDKLVHPIIADDLEFELEFSGTSVKAGNFLDCFGLETQGDVEVGEWFDCDVARIGGHLYAANIYLEDDLWVSGLVLSQNNLTCDSLFAGEVRCNGDLECGSIQVHGGDISVLGTILTSDRIVATGNIQAGKWIAAGGEIKCGAYVKAGEFVVSDEGILAGDDYGIFAGLCLSRSQWLERGYVSAPKKPRNVLTGRFVEGKTWEMAADEVAEREALCAASVQG